VRVLIVDDEIRIRLSVARVLSRRGFLLDMAATLAEAASHLEANVYDAILLDWQLPDGVGIEFLRVIRQRQPRTFVLIITGRDSSSDRLRAFDAGADDYVVKHDIDVEEVASRLLALERRRSLSA
jgi:two-component system OmpR family response regulator